MKLERIKIGEITMYVIIRDMSAGNAETGEAWQETKIFDENATLKEVMKWANEGYNGVENDYSRKRITITKPHTEDKSKNFSKNV